MWWAPACTCKMAGPIKKQMSKRFWSFESIYLNFMPNFWTRWLTNGCKFIHYSTAMKINCRKVAGMQFWWRNGRLHQCWVKHGDKAVFYRQTDVVPTDPILWSCLIFCLWPDCFFICQVKKRKKLHNKLKTIYIIRNIDYIWLHLNLVMEV